MILTQPRWGIFGQRYGSFADKEDSVSPPAPPVVVVPPGGGGPALGPGFRMPDNLLEKKKKDVDIAVALMMFFTE